MIKLLILRDHEKMKMMINNMPAFEKKHKLNMRDSNGRTILFYAIYYNSYEMIEFLLRNGSDSLWRDSKQKTVLHHAVTMNCDKSIIQLLIDYNTEYNQNKSHCMEAASINKEIMLNQRLNTTTLRPFKIKSHSTIHPGMDFNFLKGNTSRSNAAVLFVKQNQPAKTITP